MHQEALKERGRWLALGGLRTVTATVFPGCLKPVFSHLCVPFAPRVLFALSEQQSDRQVAELCSRCEEGVEILFDVVGTN